MQKEIASRCNTKIEICIKTWQLNTRKGSQGPNLHSSKLWGRSGGICKDSENVLVVQAALIVSQDVSKLADVVIFWINYRKR